MFHIKLRKRGEKAFWFLASSNGSMNRLRIHAVQFETKERAGTVLQSILTDNPEFEGKVTS